MCVCRPGVVSGVVFLGFLSVLRTDKYCQKHKKINDVNNF